MSKIATLFITMFCSIHLFASNLEPTSHCDQKLTHNYYSICYIESHRQALWTFHKLTFASINGSAKRKNNYRLDPNLADPVTKNDYKNTGYDRGHLVPAGDMKLNNLAMSETFFMSNMSPQKPELNREIWNSLESAIRKMVSSLGEAYVVTAPILSDHLSKLPSQVSIPKYFYKIAYFPAAKIMRAYLFENRAYNDRNYANYQVSVDQIENLTGIDFFAELEDTLEDQLERQIQ